MPEIKDHSVKNVLCVGVDRGGNNIYAGDTKDARLQWPKAKGMTIKMPNKFRGETDIVILEVENAEGTKEAVVHESEAPQYAPEPDPVVDKPSDVSKEVNDLFKDLE